MWGLWHRALFPGTVNCYTVCTTYGSVYGFAARALTLSSEKTRVWCGSQRLQERAQEEIKRRGQEGLPCFKPADAREEAAFWADGVEVYGMAFGSPAFIQAHVDAKAEAIIQSMRGMDMLNEPITDTPGVNPASPQAQWVLLRQSGHHGREVRERARMIHSRDQR